MAGSDAAAQPAPAQAPPDAARGDQLDRIEHKLDELLRRLPPASPDSRPSAPATAGGAPGAASSPAPSGAGESAAGLAASPSAGYQPGLLAVVRPAPAASAVLAIPADSVGGFVYEGGTLRLDDLSSRGLRWRAPVGVELQGWLRARESGRYQVAVDFGSPRAGAVLATLSCGLALWLEDRQVGQRSGDLNLRGITPEDVVHREG